MDGYQFPSLTLHSQIGAFVGRAISFEIAWALHQTATLRTSPFWRALSTTQPR